MIRHSRRPSGPTGSFRFWGAKRTLGEMVPLFVAIRWLPSQCVHSGRIGRKKTNVVTNERFQLNNGAPDRIRICDLCLRRARVSVFSRVPSASMKRRRPCNATVFDHMLFSRFPRIPFGVLPRCYPGVTPADRAAKMEIESGSGSDNQADG